MDIKLTISDISSGFRQVHQLPEIMVTKAFGRYELECATAGFCEFTTHPTNHPHRHDNHHELCMVLAGNGRFAHADENHALGFGSVFISDLDVIHEISSHDTRDLRIVFLKLRIHEAEVPVSERYEDQLLHSFQQSHINHAPRRGELFHYLSQLIAPQFDEAHTAYRNEELLLMWVLDSLACLQKGSVSPHGGPQQESLRRALNYIEHHMTSSIDVAHVAAHAGCSPRHLSRMFRQALGKTTVQVITELRLQRASQMLLMGFKVNEVAEAVGIGAAAPFCRLFKREFGVTAKQYQKRHSPAVHVATSEFVSSAMRSV